MLSQIFQSHPMTLFMMLACLAVILSVGAVIVVTHLIPLETRQNENSALGYVAIMISLIYGVLVGLTSMYLVNTISITTMVVQAEANAVVNLLRESEWMNGPSKIELQKELDHYVNQVVKVEWPMMRLGKPVPDVGELSIYRMSSILKNYKIETESDEVLAPALLSEIKVLYNARESRIAKSYDSLSPVVWAAIFAGTILIVLITYLFGMSFYMHLFASSAVTLMAFAMIFLLITLDKPFQGQYVVQSDEFIPIVEYINNHPH